MSADEPACLTLELVRARDGGDPFAFQRGRQEYLARTGTGAYRGCTLDWDSALEADLAELASARPSAEAMARVGRRLRDLLDNTPFPGLEDALEAAARQGPPVLITLRLAAAELLALPWELVPLRRSGLLLGQIEGALIRLCWPDTRTAPAEDRGSAPAGRVLVASSAAGGPVPHEEHVAALARAGADEAVFHPERDVLTGASLARLRETLEAAAASGRPYTALHLLSHGALTEGGGVLLLDGGPRGAAQVDRFALQETFGGLASSLRLVVIAACSAGSSGAPGALLGSVALALHRAGIASVLAARSPLSVAGAGVFARELWGGLLTRSESLERATRRARAALGRAQGLREQSALTLYGREEDGHDTRPVPLQPYRGLLSFEISDRELFFGRAAETAALVARVEAAGRQERRVVVVVGASGSGKSSLVRAGLAPALVERDPSWQICPLRLDLDLDEQVNHALASLVTGARALWLVDPLDALFSSIADDDARSRAAGALLALAGDPGGVLVATLRPDLLSRCAEVVLPDGRRLDAAIYADDALFFLAAPDREQLRAAIERPAARVGLSLEPGLADRLLDDAGVEPGALPLLQYALDRLWTTRRGRRLTHASYEASGGLGGALAQAADGLISRLEGAADAAWAVLCGAVTVDMDGQPRRRAAPVSEIRQSDPAVGADLDRALVALVQARLVVLADVGGRPTVELAHEALLRRWEALRVRVLRDRENRQQAEEIRTLAARWAARGRDPDDLLRGRALGFALEVTARAWRHPPEAVAALLEASVAAERATAEAEAAALAEQRRLAREAEVQARRARDAALLAQARLLRDQDPTLALLLLREAASEVQEAGWISEALALLQRPLCGEVFQLTSISIDLRAACHPERPSRWVVPRGDHAEILDLNGALPPVELRGHRGPVTDAAWSPDGASVVTASADGTAKRWSAEGAHLGELTGPAGPLALARFSPDGRQVLMASKAGLVSLVPVDGAPPTRLPGQIGGLRLACFSDDGRWLATVAEREPRTIRVRALDQAQELTLKAGDGELRCLSFAPLEPRLLAGGDDGVLRIWSLPANTPITVNLEVPLCAAAWSRDGAVIYAGDRQGRVHVLAPQPGAAITSFMTGPRPVSGLLAAPGGQLWALHGAGELSRWRVDAAASGQEVPRHLGRHRERGSALRWGAEGALVASAAVDGSVWIASADGARRLELCRRGAEVGVLRLSPGGSRLAAGADDGSVRVWDTERGEAPTSLVGHAGPIECLAWSPDGRLVASGSQDGRILIHEVATGRVQGDLREHRNSVCLLAFAPDGAALWSASEDRTARLWREGRCLLRIGPDPVVASRPDPEAVAAASEAADGGLVVALEGGEVRVFDADGAVGARVCSLRAPARGITLSPDGRWLAVGTRDGEIQIWRRGGDRPVFRDRLDGDAVEGLMFDGTGRRLMVRTRAGALVLVADDGVGVPLRLALPAPAVRAALHPGGELLAVLDEQGAVSVWPVGCAAIRALIDEASRVALTPEQRQRLLGEWRHWGER